jgi:hypothetical protein
MVSIDLRKETGEMEAIFAAAAFVVLFGAWVVVPTIVKKRHASNDESEK